MKFDTSIFRGSCTRGSLFCYSSHNKKHSKPVNLLVFSGIFCKIRFRKLNRGKHEEAFSYLREIRVERCLLSVVIFTIAEWHESDGTGMEGVFLCRDICFLNREINHDD